MIITTSNKPNPSSMIKANLLANELNGVYVEREKKSLLGLMEEYNVNELIVIEKENVKFFSKTLKKPFYFHPSMAILRINRLKQGDNDLMVQISNLRSGDSFLDCTLGLGSDSIVASYVVGSLGKVLAFESQQIIAKLVRDGLQKGWTKDDDVDQSMKRIKVIAENHFEGLKKLPDKSFDIVYFDPMFRKGIYKSSSINPLRDLANINALTKETIAEAKRVAKRKIILKEDIKSNEFERLGFQVIPRSSPITYGVISIIGDE